MLISAPRPRERLQRKHRRHVGESARDRENDDDCGLMIVIAAVVVLYFTAKPTIAAITIE